MAPLQNLSFPQLVKVTGDEQHIEVSTDATKLVSSVDGSFAGVDISDLASRTQKITSDGTSTFVSGDLNLESGNLNVQGEILNIQSSTQISDNLVVSQSAPGVSAVVIENSNSTLPPLVVKHGSNGDSIFSLATDGTITNSNIQTIESNLATEISDRTTAVSAEQSARSTADANLQSQITQEISDRTSAVAAVQSQLTQEIADRTQDVIDETNLRVAAIDALQSEVDDLSAEVQTNNAAQQAEIDAVEVRCDDLEEKTQLLTADSETSTFSGKLSWGVEKFFCIKARAEETLTDVQTMTKTLDMTHLYSIDGVSGNKIATYQVIVQDKTGSVQSPYFSAQLVLGSDGSVLIPITSFKINSSSFDHSTSELTLNFSENISKTLVITWTLLS